MDKIVFVFSGQGDQFSGMGKDLYEKYPAAKNVYDMCDSIRPGTSDMCFGGSEEELKETKNTQPCLFATELAMARVLTQLGVEPYAVAGFSLGEVVGAAFSEMFDDATGFGLVCARGELMQSEAGKYDTSMAAVVKLGNSEVISLCDKYSHVYPVNFNCPGQVSVSGLTSQMTDFAASVKEAGGRAIPIKVKGGFHSPFMKAAAKGFAEELKKVQFGDRKYTLYSNMTAKPYEGDAAALLSAQICNPVKWEDTIRDMLEKGVDTFVEIGPGKTLTNMIKRIDPDVRALGFDEYLAEVEAC